MFKTLTLIAAMFFSTAHAADLAYDCEVIVVAEDLPQGSVKVTYSTEAKASTSHGGEDQPFEFQRHRLVANSNGKWLSLTWAVDGVIIARSLVARSDANQGAQVLIIYNPNNFDEQASVSCSARLPVAP